jgi:hypothetical protein
MKHMASGAIACIGVLALASCYSYPSAAINNSNYDQVQATPQFLYMKVGDSTQVLARLINDADVGAVTSYNVSAVGAGILVHYQVNYRPYYNSVTDTLAPVGDKNQQQYYVVGTAIGIYTFTLTPTSVNTGISKTVTVTVVAADLGAALNKTTANSGDTVTITAPATTVFSQTSVVTFATGAPVVITNRSADSTKISFIVGPNVTGPVTVTKVGFLFSPTANVVTISSANSLVTGPAPVTVSNANPAIGVPITATLGGTLKFIGNSHIFVGTDTGQREAGVVSVSADSTVITFVPFIASNGVVNFTNLALSSAVTLCNASTTAATIALNCTATTTTAPGVVVAGTPIEFTAIAAPTVTLSNVYGGGVNPNGATTTAAAPLIVFTTYGATTTTNMPQTRSFMISDNGPFSTAVTPCVATIFAGPPPGGKTPTGCRYYKTVLATQTFTGTLAWDKTTTTDLGFYTLNSTLATSAVVADVFGNEQGNNPPETGIKVSTTGATFFLVVVDFGAALPQYFQVRYSQP